MMWAGPYATRLLAEMGAEVIKIESPRAWDNVRTLLPQPGAPEPWNTSYYFNDYNRDKKSLTLDLAQPRGRALFLELVAKCDCVIENYRADVLDKLGIGWDVLREAGPTSCSSAWRASARPAPKQALVGFGPIIEQMAGMASTTGYGDDGIPYKTGISYGDPIGGIAAAGAVVLALIARRRSGRGAWIDLAQRETMAQMIGPAFAAASLRGEAPVHRGNRDRALRAAGRLPVRGRATSGSRSRRATTRSGARSRARSARPSSTSLPLAERRARHDELDRQHRSVDPRFRTARSRRVAAACRRRGRARARLQRDPPRPAPRRARLLGRAAASADADPGSSPPPRGAWSRRSPQPRRHAPLFGEHNREILCGLLGPRRERARRARVRARDRRRARSARAPVDQGPARGVQRRRRRDHHHHHGARAARAARRRAWPRCARWCRCSSRSYVRASCTWASTGTTTTTCCTRRTASNGWILWANLHLLFWLSLFPFATAWVGENPRRELARRVLRLRAAHGERRLPDPRARADRAPRPRLRARARAAPQPARMRSR